MPPPLCFRCRSYVYLPTSFRRPPRVGNRHFTPIDAIGVELFAHNFPVRHAFVQYVRDQEPLRGEKLPRKLMRTAIAESIKLDRKEPRFPDTDELEDILPLLPPSDRAVFILRSTLDVSAIETAGILQLPIERVNESWLKASLYLRDIWLKKKSGAGGWQRVAGRSVSLEVILNERRARPGGGRGSESSESPS